MEQEITELRKQLQTSQRENRLLKEENTNYQLLITKLNQNTLNKQNETHYDNEHNEFWSKIRDALINKKYSTDYIKSLIKNKKLKMDDVDNCHGQTLLIMAAYEGAYEIVELCLNLGANINYTDKYGKTAIEYARKSERTAVEQLLLFNEMNVNIGNRIQETASTINRQKGVIENIVNQLSFYDDTTKEFFENTMIDLMINIINKKLAFSDDLLNLCWQFTSNNCDPLQSDLWKILSKTCTEIINNGDKRDWYWFKQYIIPSTIWYNIVSDDSFEEKQNDDNVASYNSYLYYKLLDLVDSQSKNQLNELDKKLKHISNEYPTDWNALIKWDIPHEYDIIRQDKIPNGIEAKYTFNLLSEYSADKFNSHKFYDYNQYLSQLILLAQIVDDDFHKSVQSIFNVNPYTKIGIINNEKTNNKNFVYVRGPVKLVERARNKAENDYFDEIYPTTACILDLNRCSLIFNDIKTLLSALKLFVNKVKYYQSGIIIGICRDKNGWKEYIKNVQYADIKLNILIKGKQNNIVGEIQFLLRTMMDFKHKAHNLYSIQRNREYFENCVSKILPSLLNEDKQLLIAANMGNLKGLLNLMVINNKIPKYLLKMIKGNFHTQSILTIICMNDDDKLFIFLQSIIDINIFTQTLFTPNDGNKTPIEECLKYESKSLLKKIFEIKLVKEKYLNENKWLFRLLHWIVRCQDVAIIDWIFMDILKDISNEKIIKIMNSPKQFGYNSTIIIRYIERDNLKILKKFVSRIGGDKAFINNVFINDCFNRNGLDCAIHRNNLEIVKYIMSFDEIKQKCKNNKDIQWRIIWGLNNIKYNKYDEFMAKYLTHILDLNQMKLKALQSFKCKVQFDSNLNQYYHKNAIKYWEKTITNDQIQKLLPLL